MEIRSSLTFGLLLAATSAFAADYYIAPDGRPDAPASLEAPAASLTEVQPRLKPGDTVYFRGGTYRPRVEDAMGVQKKIYTCAFVLDRSGEEGRPITYAAYPGEQPVFDMSDFRPEGQRVSVFWCSGSWLRLVGLEVTGTQVTVADGSNTQSEAFSNNGGSHNIYECLSIHDGMAIGWYLVKGSDNLVLNCDAYCNYDPVSGAGGNVDGFGCHPSAGDTGNTLRGCRAWWNSDDGFDLIHSAEAVTIENCYAFFNGFKPNTFKSAADGNGFKAGGYGMAEDSKIAAVIPRHVVRNCLSVYNRAGGFYANHHLGGLIFVNNTAARNRVNYNMVNRKSAAEAVDVPGYDHVLAYNLSYNPREAHLQNLDEATATLVGNSFIGASLSLSDADFVSIDETRLAAPRLSDGSLAALGLFVPTETSQLTSLKLGYTFPAPSLEDIMNGTTEETEASWLSVPTILVEGLSARLIGPLGTEKATQFYVDDTKVSLKSGVADLSEYAGKTVSLKAYDTTTGMVCTLKTTLKP